MNMLAHLHPAIVHLPLALWASVPVLFSFARRHSGTQLGTSLAAAGTVNLLAGSGCAVIALASGMVAVSALDVVGIAQNLLTRHIGWASITSLTFITLAILRAVGRPLGEMPGATLTVITWLALAPLLATGYYGGMNVYHFGLGVDLDSAVKRAHGKPVILPPSPAP